MNISTDPSSNFERVRSEALAGSRNVWLAGLGFVSTVDETARDTVTRWIARGEKLEKREKNVVGEFVQERSERVRKVARDVEARVEHGVQATLDRFGIPRRNDLRDLSDRIEKLSRELEALGASES